MRICLIADAFPPLRSSGAVQLRDLSCELAAQGHDVTVMVASADLDAPCRVESFRGVCVVRLKAPQTKDVGYVRRTFGELLMPFLMLRNLRRSPLRGRTWEGVVWYSPTIFLGPMARALKKSGRCRGYLIVRDIFPEWAVDMGIMGKGLPYRFFKAIAGYQYGVADVIGIQTPGNAAFFGDLQRKSPGKIEVLHNWLADAPPRGCSICVANTRLAGRRIFVYAGNMGVAQGVGRLLDVARHFRDRNDVGFIFVGRGKEATGLRDEARQHALMNTLFFDEIDPDEVPGLYAQCAAGLVALDTRHKTHNIPGKFLSYMQSGLPVLAAVNEGNDLVQLIRQEKVGYVSTDGAPDMLAAAAAQLLGDVETDPDLSQRCRGLAARMFSASKAAQQIVVGLTR